METGLASLWPISVLTEALNCYFDAITVTLPMEMGHNTNEKKSRGLDQDRHQLHKYIYMH